MLQSWSTLCCDWTNTVQHPLFSSRPTPKARAHRHSMPALSGMIQRLLHLQKLASKNQQLPLQALARSIWRILLAQASWEARPGM